jgi:hypothetical protein
VVRCDSFRVTQQFGHLRQRAGALDQRSRRLRPLTSGGVSSGRARAECSDRWTREDADNGELVAVSLADTETHHCRCLTDAGRTETVSRMRERALPEGSAQARVDRTPRDT